MAQAAFEEIEMVFKRNLNDCWRGAGYEATRPLPMLRHQLISPSLYFLFCPSAVRLCGFLDGCLDT